MRLDHCFPARTRGRRLFLFLLLAGSLWSWSTAEANSGGFRGPFNVGLKILDIPYQRDSRGSTMTVAVWYPSQTSQRPHHYTGKTDGFVAVDGAPLTEKGPYPLLVFSHGFGGSGYSSVFFQEALASYGWVVVAPDHHDSMSMNRIHQNPLSRPDGRAFFREAGKITASGPDDRAKYLYRLDEMQFVLNSVLSMNFTRPLIDLNRIAVGGHSFGGYTALGLCGTIPERRDPRIKALLLFSTGAGGYLYTENELAAVRMPSMLLFGEKEANDTRGDKTMRELSHTIYQKLSSPNYLLEVKGASHFTFNNRLSDTFASRYFAGTEEHFNLINKYAVAFLENYVAGNSAAETILRNGDPRLASILRK